jgi:hypothetical protein
VLQEVWVHVSEETRLILERFTLQHLVERTKIGHPDAVPGADSDSAVGGMDQPAVAAES